MTLDSAIPKIRAALSKARIEILSTCATQNNWDMSAIEKFPAYKDVAEALALCDAILEAAPEGLEYAAEHVEKLDKEMRGKSIYPPSYSMRVPPDENYCSDLQIKKVCKATALLNQITRKEL